MLVFVLNAGSSSLKYQLIDSGTAEVKATGIVERIGIDGVLQHETDKKFSFEFSSPTHKEAVEKVLEVLTSGETKVIDSINEIEAIGHRVVHGGEYFKGSALVDDKVVEEIEKLVPLAPLHNPAHILGIKICRELMPQIPNVVVFDTAFHQTMKEESFLYAIPYEDYQKYHIRKYGFHGTSHYYVSNEAVKLLNKENSKVIVCHLGNGSSMCAVQNGESKHTSMGLTPLEGLVMGTRSGDIDPTAVALLGKEKNMSADEVVDYLNKKSGLLGVSGVSSDLREIMSAAEDGNHRAQVAISMMTDRIKRYIGSYAAQMGGVDAICFTAGIGENASLVREKVCENLEFMGIEIDKEKNSVRESGIREINSKNSKVKVYIIPTNEEFVIARDTYEIVKNK